jgi:hypothetical protein
MEGPIKGQEGSSQEENGAPRRHIMATANELKEKAYFEDVYEELEGIKMRIFILRKAFQDLRQ